MIVDIVIVLMVISALYRGRETGFVRQVFSSLGFFGGLYLGIKLGHNVSKFASDSASEATLILVTVIMTALLTLAIADHLGSRLKHKFSTKRLDKFDGVLGSILSGISILVTVWFISSAVHSLPLPSLQSLVDKSRIVSLLNNGLPPSPQIIEDIGKLVDPNGFPQVFIGREPNPKSVKIPDLGELQAAVVAAKPSVVKVYGQGCGGTVEGSGFVISGQYVATNAHVIAGIKQPSVHDDNGNHSATPVLFDPNLDFAILRVSGLAGKALTLDPAKDESGTPAATLGYPGGGPFTAGPAAVLDSFTASGRNIYGKKSTTRDVYELRADVIPGNSGGPVIAKNGSVIGVIFAESTTYDHVGYALTAAEVKPLINRAVSSTTPVNTGKCADS